MLTDSNEVYQQLDQAEWRLAMHKSALNHKFD